MDWHHDDYLPRLAFEADERPAESHDVMDYIKYMRRQIREIVTQGQPFVLWYDGGWMNTPDDLGASSASRRPASWTRTATPPPGKPALP